MTTGSGEEDVWPHSILFWVATHLPSSDSSKAKLTAC